MSGTPPGTTLSTPSPTELHDTDPLQNMKPIYLIVATTRVLRDGTVHLGIGNKGSLPWPQIKADMAFFRKATTSSSSGSRQNAVIMGRKTWESIPKKFRPLKGRVNVIVTRNLQAFRANMSDAAEKDVEVVDKVEHAVEIGGVEGLFCIGGAEIYSLFLKDKLLKPRLRILQTEVKRDDGTDFECDTFWPEQLDAPDADWVEVSKQDVSSWTGTAVPQGDHDWQSDTDAGVSIRVRGWQHVSVKA